MMSNHINITYIAKQEIKNIIDQFCLHNWDFESSIKKINKIYLKHYNRNFDFGLDSIHLLIMAAISEYKDIRSVLELGTFMGKTTKLMLDIFPNATIRTVDLPHDDEIYKVYASTIRGGKKFLEQQANENLRSERIEMIRSNSFLISPNQIRNCDLVWVDGGHMFPDIAWDLYLSWHATKLGGYVLCDDIAYNASENVVLGKDHVATSVEYMENRLNIKFTKFIKRINKKYLDQNKKFCKYVGVTQKT